MKEKAAEYLRNHIPGIVFVGIVSSLCASYIFKWVDSSSPIQKDPIIIHAVKGASDQYFQGGMAGLEVEVGDCYANLQASSTLNEVENCFAIDLAAGYIGDAANKTYTFPRQEYFEFERAIRRVRAAFQKTNVPPWTREDLLNKQWIPSIRVELEALASQLSVPRKAKMFGDEASP